METDNKRVLDENDLILFHKLWEHGVYKGTAICFIVMAEDEQEKKDFIAYLDAHPDAKEDEITLWVDGDETHEPHIHYEEPEEEEEEE